MRHRQDNIPQGSKDVGDFPLDWFSLVVSTLDLELQSVSSYMTIITGAYRVSHVRFLKTGAESDIFGGIGMRHAKEARYDVQLYMTAIPRKSMQKCREESERWKPRGNRKANKSRKI